MIPCRNPHRRPARPRWTRFRFSVGTGHLTRCTSLFLEWSVASYSGLTGTLFLCPLLRLGGRQGMGARASGPLRARVGPGWDGSWWFGFCWSLRVFAVPLVFTPTCSLMNLVIPAFRVLLRRCWSRGPYMLFLLILHRSPRPWVLLLPGVPRVR